MNPENMITPESYAPPEGSVEARLVEALRTVHDPEIPINLFDLGLIYTIEVDGSRVRIQMTLTSPNCPVAEQLPSDVQRAVRGVEGVADVEIELVWTPKWSPDRMTEAAKLELEFTGHTGPASARMTPLTMSQRPWERWDRQGRRERPASAPPYKLGP